MNILIVEDARDQRLMLSVVLKKQGHKVLEAENGKEALAILQEHQEVRIIISDWMMPEMDGLELLKETRKSDLGRYIYFILLTGNTDHEAVVEGMNHGADDFLAKPVNFDELAARLKAGIRIIELEKQLEQQKQQLVQAIETVEKDLESAAKAQEVLLAQPATIQHVSFDWFFKPSKILGGDMFGYQAIDGETLSFYQLDVAGHGIPSALFSFTLNNILSESSGRGSIVKEKSDQEPFYKVRAPEKVLASLNKRFQVTPESMLYFTIAYGHINSRSGEVTVSQAGHPPPLWIRREKASVEPVAGGGVPIGMMPDMDYTSCTLQFQPGDRLFLYSDGVTECENTEGEQFGESRLLQCLMDTLNDDLKSVIDQVEKNVRDWSELDRFDDDVTYLLLEWKP
ncbi:PP2C family protein-serine/threonine phosphatase [Endozoicomonas numazuensis]|uniref:PP2C family protein-serine/threonine phosphatase n=1 Tax=Endozoicomonas numazuensis TaxID=1137799 RepID=UPI000559020B|nr:SpoIIE family protein phosphatase [Endozoicomonas numazuensis]